MALIPGFSLGGHATHVIQQFTDSQSRARARVIAAGGSEEAAGNCLRGRYNELRNRVIERTDTNYIRNSAMNGATGSVLPLNWESSIPAGLTATISASGVASGYTYVDFKIAGTATTDGTLSLWFEKTTGPPSQAFLNDIWVGSAFLNLAAGAVSGIPGISLQLAGVNNAGVVQESFSSSLVGLSSGGFNRFEQTGTIANSNTTFTNLRITHTVVNGTLYDYTIRIAAPQLEKGTFFAGGYKASPFILTPGNAIASRITGRPSLLIVPQLTRQSGTNLIKQSEAFNTAEWGLIGLNAFGSGSVANSTATTDPFGGTNADYIQENSASGTHLIAQINAGQVSGTNLTFSVFAKAAERTQIVLLNNSAGGGTAIYNLTAGTATFIGGVSASIQNYGNGWYRCILTYNPTLTGNFNIQVRLVDASGNTSYTGTGTSGVYVFGAQMETGSTATPYIPTTTGSVFRDGTVFPQLPTVSGADFTFTRATTATRVNASGLIQSVASGLLRIDYPVTGGCPAALIEPSATNLDLNSANFTSYNLTNVSATTVATSNPFVGVTGVTKLTPSAVSGQHRAFISVALSSSGRISAIVKAGGYNFFSFAEGGGLSGQGTIFDLSNGTVATNAGANPVIQSVGDGWYRCSIDATLTSNVGRFFIVRNANSTTDYSGDESAGILFCHKQIETGSVATSPIVTSGASATRAADVCSVSGVSGYIGQTEGTLYAEVDARNFTNLSRIFTISDGTTSNRVIILFNTSNRIRTIVTVGGSPQADINTSTLTAGIYKVAVAYKQDDFAMYVNGSQIGTDTSGSVPACSAISLGKDEATTTAQILNDRLRAAAIYTTRLSNDQLASLTRLT